MSSTSTSNTILSLIPLVFPLWFLIPLLEDPIPTVLRWIRNLVDKPPEDAPAMPPVSSQLLAYVAVALLGYAATSKLVPNIKVCYVMLSNILEAREFFLYRLFRLDSLGLLLDWIGCWDSRNRLEPR
jgi:hypothetical protein